MAKTKTQIKAEEFRQLSTDEQIRALRGTRVERVFSVERAAVNMDERTVTLSISSEQPYERWWGVEILDHSAAAINADRLKQGAPLLVGHDPADQVGVVDSYEITPDRKLQVNARFSRSARAAEILQDVADGIRRNASVGYTIDELVLESQQGDVNTYRVTQWTPFEGSIVPIPADPTVGVGRSDNPDDESFKEILMPDKQTERQRQSPAPTTEAPVVAAAPPIDAEKVSSEARAAEQKRVSELLNLGNEFIDYDGPDLARELVLDPNGSVETFRAKMMEKMKTKPTATAQPAEFPGASTVSARMIYNPLKAFTRDLQMSDGRVMKAEEAAYRSGMWLAASVYGREKAQQWCRDHGVEYRVMSGNTLTGGGAIVPVEMEQAVIDLRNQYGVARKLARIRPMNSDTLLIPRRTGGVTAYFFDDATGTGPTASDKSWDNVELSAKKVGALTKVSQDLVEDAIINVIDDLANEMAYAFAVKEDDCFINGDGTSTYGGMQGLITKFEGTAYTSRIALTTGHNLLSEVDATDMGNVMGGVAPYGMPGAKFVMSQAAANIVIGRLKASAGGNTVQSLGGPAAMEYLGYPIVLSEAMPHGTAATDYTSKVMFMFGRFDLGCSFGDRRGITVQVLNERYAELGEIGIIATERFHIVNHDLGTTSARGPIAAAYGA